MARDQCKQPYVISAGQSGGVVMHLADQATPQELRLKGSPSGKNYIGPPGPTPGEQDREIVSFDGRVMVTRFIDGCRDPVRQHGLRPLRAAGEAQNKSRHRAGVFDCLGSDQSNVSSWRRDRCRRRASGR
jgi:hypothetical protein